MASWSTQDVRIDGNSIMTRGYWITNRGALDTTPGFRSTNFPVSARVGTLWRPKQIPEVVRTLDMTVDSADPTTGMYASSGVQRIGQLNANLAALLGFLSSRQRQVLIERDVLTPAGSTVTWYGYCQATTPIMPESPEDFDDYLTLQIDLLFADPTWYGAAITGSSFGGGQTINNTSGQDAYNMQITFSGGGSYLLTNTSRTPNVWMRVDASGTVVVDTQAGTVTDGSGNNLLGVFSHAGIKQWFVLQPGNNVLTVSGGNAQVTYNPPSG